MYAVLHNLNGKKCRKFFECFETVFTMYIPSGKSSVFDFLFSMTIFYTNIETKSKKSPFTEIQDASANEYYTK